jgi:glycosyltransferase involved in cell wall biosynthesis
MNSLLQKLTVFFSSSVIANDAEYVEANVQKPIKWMLVPLSELWWNNSKPQTSRSDKKTALFVGSFSNIKGWPTVKKLIDTNKDINWMVVSKYAEDEHGLGVDKGANWQVKRQLNQEELRSLMSKADVLVVASPYETQCLVALEALSQNTPVLTTPTGVLGSMGVGNHKFGLVSKNLESDFKVIIKNLNSYSPREFVETIGVLGNQAWGGWVDQIKSELEESFLDLGKPGPIASFFNRLVAYALTTVRTSYRKLVKPSLLLVYSQLRTKPRSTE